MKSRFRGEINISILYPKMDLRPSHVTLRRINCADINSSRLRGFNTLGIEMACKKKMKCILLISRHLVPGVECSQKPPFPRSP